MSIFLPWAFGFTYQFDRTLVAFVSRRSRAKDSDVRMNRITLAVNRWFATVVDRYFACDALLGVSKLKMEKSLEPLSHTLLWTIFQLVARDKIDDLIVVVDVRFERIKNLYRMHGWFSVALA